MLAKSDTTRLFFALWPAPEIQRALGKLAQDLQRDCGGRPVPSGNIHLTLAFLGNVERGRMARLGEIAAAIRAECFELNLSRVDWWRRNRIVWAGVEECPGALRALAAGLEQLLAPEGFRFDGRPYVPHVTLLRDARRAPPASAVPALRWKVTRFALVESAAARKGRNYAVLRDWPLTA